MKTLHKAIILGLGMSLPFGVMASPGEDVTIRVMEMNETNPEHVMEMIELPEMANEHARTNAQHGMDHANNRATDEHDSEDHANQGEMRDQMERNMERERNSDMEHEMEREMDRETGMGGQGRDMNDINDRVNEEREEHGSFGGINPEDHQSPRDFGGAGEIESGDFSGPTGGHGPR